MRKFILMGIFAGMTLLNILGLFLFNKVNSPIENNLLDKALDLSSEYGVKLDVDYLRNNFEPAHE